MTNTNIFETALKSKLRFPYKGVISTEDLFDLGTTDLDLIFKTLKREETKVNEESLLSTPTAADKELAVKIAIVKHIFTEKVAEAEKRTLAKVNAEKRKQLEVVLAKKQADSLENMTEEQIIEALNALDN